jgi:hypothetical protein
MKEATMEDKDYTDGLELDRQMPCVVCPDRQACEARQETDSWIYSDQFAHCLDLDHPDYHDVDWWVLHETMQGRECTPEELEKLHMELGIQPDAL